MANELSPVKNRYFYFLIAGIFLIIISRAFLSDGLFMDGMMYATMARNLAHGLGTFWEPHLTDTFFPQFINHPPLAIWLESLLFRILGDNRFVERIYSVSAIILTAYIITSIWKELGNTRRSAWLPLLFWIAMPTITWASVNNMLENTMGIFVCLSVLFCLFSFRQRKIYFAILSGMMLTLGFLTKGPVTFFPISFPVFYWISTRKINFGKAVTTTIIITTSALLFLATLYFLTPAREIFPKYLGITFSLTFNDATKSSRFYIIGMFLKEMIPTAIILALMIARGLRKGITPGILKTNISAALAFFFLGLSGVLPLMITRVQSGYYYQTSLAFFAIASALFIQPVLEDLLSRQTRSLKGIKIFSVISVLILATGIILSLAYTGTINRDRQLIRDTRIIIPQLEENSTVSILPAMAANWSIHVYFARNANISLDPDTANDHNYIIVQNNIASDDILKKYERTGPETGFISLYRKKQ